MSTNPNIWLVTGVGTDVGKTFAASALLRAAHATGKSVRIVKAVQTGCARAADGTLTAPDVEVYGRACPEAARSALRCFENPCSPHLAVAMEGGAPLRVRNLAEEIFALAHSADITIVEGAGGLLVPLNEDETFADLAVALGGQTIVVACNALGGINHALLTLEALRLRGIGAEALILNQLRPTESTLDTAIAADNETTLHRMAKAGGVDCVAILPPYAKEDWDDAAARLSPVVRHLLTATNTAEDVLAFDRAHLWHPYASTLGDAPLWEVASTQGTEIRLKGGRTLTDGMSSWWAAVHGYNHPRLVAALRQQAATMPHVMFGGLTHAPAARLAEQLLRLAPKEMERVFFVDSGSVAVEAALKMALQCQQATGNAKKQHFLTALGGYHGDTTGAMSVCDPENGMHRLFTGILARQIFVERPSCRFDEEFDPASLAPMREAFAHHNGEIAAVIIEPVVQGAGGMWFYHPEYLRGLRELCDEHGALLILDEIATGFGRTGKMFAAEWAGVAPDILCVGKALTGGSMTLAAVLTREAVAEKISRNGVFMHGPTFMANPLACAVALASLSVLAESPWQANVARLESRIRTGLKPCREMPGVADVRTLGGIGVVEMEREVNTTKLQPFFVEAGVWIRPFAKLIYIMPPFISSDADIDKLSGAVRAAVEEGAWR